VTFWSLSNLVSTMIISLLLLRRKNEDSIVGLYVVVALLYWYDETNRERGFCSTLWCFFNKMKIYKDSGQDQYY